MGKTRKNNQLKEDILTFLEAGMSAADVAYALEVDVSTVYRYRNGTVGVDKQPALACRQSTADYFEYFQMDKALDTGNLCNGVPIISHCDPVLEGIIAEEELQQRLDDGEEGC